MADWGFFAAGVIGLGPAFALLFYGLRRFDYPYVEKTFFDARKVFLSFAVGMVVGTVSGAFSLFAFGDAVSAYVLLVLVALFEEGFKLVFVHLRRFQRRFDTPFYGASLGLGIAGTFAFANAFAFLAVRPPDVLPVALLLVLAFAYGGLNFFTGALLGYGTTQGRGGTQVAQALGARLLFAAVFLPFAFPVAGEAAAFGFLGAALVLGLMLYRYAARFVLVDALPPELRHELRRSVRRQTSR